MRRLEIALRRAGPGAAALALYGAIGLPAASADAQDFRHVAVIEIVKPAPFVELALPAAVYGRTLQADLRDLRVVDATGERVPFAVLPPPPAATSERTREAELYPLPQRPAGAAAWPSPVDVVVEGDRISVRRTAAASTASAGAARQPPGWLFDLGTTPAGAPAPQRLRLRWSGPAEFSAAYTIETSADLRSWRVAAGGQLLALQAAGGALTQPIVALPAASARFVRLVWLDPAGAPQLVGATSIADSAVAPAVELAHQLVLMPLAASAAGDAAPPPAPRGALQFDLGGPLPVADVNLRFAAGTRIAPVRVQGRRQLGDAWKDLDSGVFYRIERDGTVAEAPPLALPTTTRYLRFLPDERAAPLDPAQTTLRVHARLATLVFAAAGTPPFRLLAGSAQAQAGALPAATLVPQFDDERQRFGQARLGAFAEVPEVARAAEQAARWARLRPGLLWGVLLLGVAGLALLVWRLARTGGAPPPAA